jgi:hypothetical protein
MSNFMTIYGVVLGVKLASLPSSTMPHAVPNYGTYTLSTDDGQEIDLYHSLFSPWDVQHYTSTLGSQEAAHEFLQGAWNQFCEHPQHIIGVCVFFH